MSNQNLATEPLIKSIVRDVPNYPKEGITFKDISPLLADPYASGRVLDDFYSQIKKRKIKVDAISGMESRGFLFGMMLAVHMHVPFIMVRKAGKLPFDKIRKEYELEYGTSVIEMHTDSVTPGMNVLIHDDLLATGGTAKAAAELIQEMGGIVTAFAFVIGLSELPGREVLSPITDEIIVLAQY